MSRPLYVLFLFSSGAAATIRRMLFETPHDELSDEEIAAVLRQSIATGGRLSRHADVYLAGICARSTWLTDYGRQGSW